MLQFAQEPQRGTSSNSGAKPEPLIPGMHIKIKSSHCITLADDSVVTFDGHPKPPGDEEYRGIQNHGSSWNCVIMAAASGRDVIRYASSKTFLGALERIPCVTKSRNKEIAHHRLRPTFRRKPGFEYRELLCLGGFRQRLGLRGTAPTAIQRLDVSVGAKGSPRPLRPTIPQEICPPENTFTPS